MPLRSLLPHRVDRAATRAVRAWRFRRERAGFAAAALEYELPYGTTGRIANRAEWLAFNDIFVVGIYDAPIEAALARSASARSLYVLDLGANVGFFAWRLLQLAARRAPTLPIEMDLVEASPTLCAMLETRFRAARLPDHVTVRVTNGIAGARTGEALLYESDFHIGNSVAPDPYARAVAARYVDLDRLTASSPTIDFLKCDIEGSEQQVLDTYPALLGRVAIGAMEIHRNACDPAACRRILEQQRFSIHVSRATPWFEELWFERLPATARMLP